MTMSEDDDFMSMDSSGADDDFLDDSEEEFDFDEDNQDGDLDFGLSKEAASTTLPAHEVPFTVLPPSVIAEQQEAMIQEVQTVLSLAEGSAAILLRHFSWNKERLLERYTEDPEAVLDAAGLGSESAGANALAMQAVPGFVCDICCDDEPGLLSFALRCGHRFCQDCYGSYLTQKIVSEGESAHIQCAHDGCARIIDAPSMAVLLPPEMNDRYARLLTRAFVESRPTLRWCPAPDCPNAVQCLVPKKTFFRRVPTVTCDCSLRFCFSCSLPDHQPAPCSLVKMWLRKCADDSETANWISAHTKECPKCGSTIEKNGGCNHMTCRKCKNEFCWMCMGVWSEHGTSWYNCNRFEEKSGADARDAQARSRLSLQRYLHYYNRYANHEQSARLDKDLAAKTEKKMVQLQTASGMSWIEVQYLNSASNALQICRQTLKWTYAFAFYLARDNRTEMFEDNQKDLEMAVEALSQMFELPIADLSDPKQKVDIMDKTTYCTKRRLVLLEYTADTLAKNDWVFNSDVGQPGESSW